MSHLLHKFGFFLHILPLHVYDIIHHPPFEVFFVLFFWRYLLSTQICPMNRFGQGGAVGITLFPSGFCQQAAASHHHPGICHGSLMFCFPPWHCFQTYHKLFFFSFLFFSLFFACDSKQGKIGLYLYLLFYALLISKYSFPQKIQRLVRQRGVATTYAVNGMLD